MCHKNLNSINQSWQLKAQRPQSSAGVKETANKAVGKATSKSGDALPVAVAKAVAVALPGKELLQRGMKKEEDRKGGRGGGLAVTAK